MFFFYNMCNHYCFLSQDFFNLFYWYLFLLEAATREDLMKEDEEVEKKLKNKEDKVKKGQELAIEEKVEEMKRKKLKMKRRALGGKKCVDKRKTAIECQCGVE
ncbi:uncharacterized protein LOC133201696 isoform X1 [Saccostrea echinata]|uniref:uncharacterized protein LOC133194765 isoform X2 n=1 Tax=Saccostrea echinata TaxID=191078 RepID=UPI002A7EE4B8|nr:uncharacterized protein LOC133194765 isoform X2 [Saccostrea echinata]XP_061193469.1 uncharacterized protein LOC133201696 isoform X1 [Saccostrea echinata]